VLSLTRVQPDTRHRFLIAGVPVATHVRLDVIPDGGLARLRINGDIVPEALAGLRERWWDALPEAQRDDIRRVSASDPPVLAPNPRIGLADH
jgi:allantoicase